jgi:EAL domain-containing protein (putative c-di-GMP-specific phosphodiesterase class I)
VKGASSRRLVGSLARNDVRARSTVGRPKDLRFDESELARAVTRSELVLHFQPIVSVRSRQCRRVEALLRWKHPRLGLLLPGDFMPSASSPALLDAIGEWVISAAVRQWLAWRKQGDALSVSINLFGPELARVETLIVGFREVDSGAITFELTPRVLTAADPVVTDAIVRLAAAGARIALDDVSAEDAPSRALGAAIDEIKISRSLVQRAPFDARAGSDLRALVELAHDYRLSCVSVGIEDAATFDLVSSLGCDYAQGHWVSRPLVPDRLAPARRWAVGLAFSGAMAFVSQAGAARANASASGGIETPMTLGGLLSSVCCLELPTLSASNALETGATLDQLRQRTGHVFSSEVVGNAVIFSEDSVKPSQRQAVARAVDRDMRELEQEFGRTFTARPAIYLFNTRASFAMGLEQMFGVRGPDAGLLAAANGGVNLSRQGAIVLNLQNLGNDSDLAIVRHELTHALVHEIIGPDAILPAWFEEGLATLQERNGTVGGTAAARHAAVALSLVTEERTTLGDLEQVSQWVQRNAAIDGQAYTVSAEAVRLIEESVSRAGLVRMLEATGNGTSFADAFAFETGQSVADFERAFPARLAADQGTARIAQTALADGVRWTLAGFTPQSAVTIRIDGVGYKLEYVVTTDKYGMYQAVFGATAPRGEYTLHASRPGTEASTRIRT